MQVVQIANDQLVTLLDIFLRPQVLDNFVDEVRQQKRKWRQEHVPEHLRVHKNIGEHTSHFFID